jgi:hypothetical protein
MHLIVFEFIVCSLVYLTKQAICQNEIKIRSNNFNELRILSESKKYFACGNSLLWNISQAQ